MSSVVFYSYNMSKNFLPVSSSFAQPNGSSVYRSSASGNVISNWFLVLGALGTVYQSSITNYFNQSQTFCLDFAAFNGGGYRSRTDNLLRARQAL